MLPTRSISFILISILGASSAWGNGSKSHEIKDLFETIRGKVFGLVIDSSESSFVEITKQVAEYECVSSQREEHNIIENLTSEWKASRPKNLEAELPKVCLVATAHLAKGFCPSELRTQFEFNFFIDATDCFNVPQKQVLTYLYNLPDTSDFIFERANTHDTDRASCQRIQTLLQVLEEGSLKNHVQSALSKISNYARTQQELKKLVRTRKLREEDSVQLSLVSMKKNPQIADLKARLARMPANAKSTLPIKFDQETEQWFATNKTTEEKISTAIGSGICTMNPLQ